MGRPSLSGSIINNMVVGRRTNRKNPYGAYFYEVTCHCANTFEVVSGNISYQQSCGCLSKKHPNYADKTNMRQRYAQMLLSHNKRSNEAPITYETFLDVSSKDCTYCGCKPSMVSGSGSDHKHQGIDRIDSSIPYVDGNVVPCCTVCNYAKRTQDVDEFKRHVLRMAIHMFSREEIDDAFWMQENNNP